MTTAMPGGAAAKAGLRYEHLWTVLRISDMLEGDVAQIRLEPPGQAGHGIELEVDIGDVTWGEQAKNVAHNFPISKLKAEKVLTGAQSQIDQGRHFRLVTSAATSDLTVLTARAKQTETSFEFIQNVSQKHRAPLEAISEEWDVTTAEAWQLLSHMEVKRFSYAELYRIVKVTLKHLYVEDPDLIIGELRNFCDQHLSRIITAPQVSAHLASKGIQRRLIVGDQNVLHQLHRTVKRQNRRIEGSKPCTGFVSRPDVRAILERLRDADSSQVFVIDGRAGSGKSTVATQVATVLQEEGWFTAVARMDSNVLLPTSDHLGREMGLIETPAVLLAGVSDGMPALLVVDQLDAASTYSGRMPDNFEAVAEVIDEVEATPNIKVLLVVRTVDLKEDPRLRSLASNSRVEQHTVGKLHVGDVRQQLTASDMTVPTSDFTLELLRVPLHLAVYSRLSRVAQTHPFRTLQELYDRYTREVRSRIENRLGQLEWMRITSVLVNYMNDNEVLAAPIGVLDAESLQEVHALESESVLVRDDTWVAFFHESFFDYLFARAFVATGLGLKRFLRESGQHLFRRAQTRQVLQHLAATDRSRFRTTTVDVLTSDEIRSHLKGVVVRVLRQIEPTSDDWLALEDVAWCGSPLDTRIRRLLNLPGWFEVADELGRWEAWLADHDQVDMVFDDLITVAKKRPLRVVELLKPYVGVSEQWRTRIRSLIEWSLTKDLVPFAVELLERGQLDDARGPIAINSDFWSLFHSLKDEDSEGAARLIGAFLNRSLRRTQQAGSADPFHSGHLSRDSHSHSVINDVASHSPGHFIHEVLPFVIHVATANQYRNGRDLPPGRRWGVAGPLSDHTVDGAIFIATEAALGKLAQTNPVGCEIALDSLRFADSLELRYLACRALASKTDPDEAVGWITADLRHFRLDLPGSSQGASHELIEVHSPNCSSELFEELESQILDYSPTWEKPEYRGYGKYVLLTALDPARMSDAARRALHDLERRFSDSQPKVPPTNGGGIVESPISENASFALSDKDWICALSGQDHEEISWSGSTLLGGINELAGVLGQRAKEDPERFSRLGIRFTDRIPAIAMEKILEAARICGEQG